MGWCEKKIYIVVCAPLVPSSGYSLRGRLIQSMYGLQAQLKDNTVVHNTNLIMNALYTIEYKARIYN